MRWMHDAKARYYLAYLNQHLFGDCALTTVWGGLGAHRGD